MDKLNLNGEWAVKHLEKDEWIPATVPGDIYADLLNSGKIQDPFYRDNENRLQWIGESSWLYRRNFEIDSHFLHRNRVYLRCHGLDTLATIFVNNRELAQTDNMFRVWEWDIKPFIQAGQNKIEILFSSTLPFIKKKQAERPLPWNGTENSKEKVACHGWVRKEQCNYGWDWGIKAVTCGIWRDIELLAFDTGRLTDLLVSQDHSLSKKVALKVTAEAERTRPETELRADIEIRLGDQLVERSEIPINNGRGTAELIIENPKKWWPNGLGDQPLYEIKVNLYNSTSSELLDSSTKQIGLRTLRLDRHPDKWGESFQFTVNGQPFFAKGANWIPADAIQARMTPERYHRLIADAAAVNINMLRIWGGGIYEDKALYDICDELGICVWQDFMFACSTYPTFNREFLSTVENEARDQVRRLRHHPCLALWCGNNELEQGLIGNRGWDHGQMPWSEYSKLFDQLLPNIVKELNPETDYWPSSPHSPTGDRTDHSNPACGNAHLWEVWHGRKPFEWYRTCEHRFNSEFGFQSFPQPRTVDNYIGPEDRNITSRIMEHHQRSGIGNTVIIQYMLDWFRLPTSFENTLWLSQILQGMAIKYACEHWRRSMPRGMGTLYWQLNDTWPTASWSSIDYYGRWKALHYMTRHFFAPLMISGLENTEKGTVEIHITNDLKEEQCGKAYWSVTDAHGERLTSGELEAKVTSGTNSLIKTLDLHEQLADHGPCDLLVWLEWRREDQTISRNLVLFSRPKHLELCFTPRIETEVRQKNDTQFTITIQSLKPALWSWLELIGEEARYSDNFIHLPGQNKLREIELQTSRPMTRMEVESKLKTHSLINTFTEN